MNTYNINDENFKKTETYKDYIEKNPSQGYLRIRAYAASQAIPIRGLKVVVSKNIDNNEVVFFEGYTNESGIIDKIILPAPKLTSNNLDVPNKTSYVIRTTYEPDNINSIYNVNIYENLIVVQNINIVPNMQFEIGDV